MMPMTTTFCRSRVRLLPFVAVLAVAASLEQLTPLSKAMAMGVRPELAVAKGAASVVDEVAHSSLDKKLKDVNDWTNHAKEGYGLWDDHKDELKKQLQPLTPGARGNSPSGAVGYVVDTGNLKSLVYGIDINSPVTRTGPCEVGARAVSCSASACRQLYGGQPSPNCVAGVGFCPSSYGDPHVLHEGKATLLAGPTAKSVISLSPYACSRGDGPSAGGAVLGLGRSGTLARAFGAFSYKLSGGQVDAVWLGAGRAQRGQGGKPTPLISNPMFPNRYYVQIASILVGNQPLQIPRGALDIQQNGSGGVYLSTTMPTVGMYLNGEVYELLKAALQAPGAESLCYSAATKVPLPTITLVFAGDAVMALQPGSSVWETRKDGARCLAVWPSRTGETILGTRAQMGRLMTYELAAGNAFGFGTVTF